MSGSDFRITISPRAVFLCANGVVQFQILLNDKQVGKTFLYNLEEADCFGHQQFAVASPEQNQCRSVFPRDGPAVNVGHPGLSLPDNEFFEITERKTIGCDGSVAPNICALGRESRAD
jgi:hypothetical protein